MLAENPRDSGSQSQDTIIRTRYVDRHPNDHEPYGIEAVGGLHLHQLLEDVAVEGEFLVVLVEGWLGGRVLLGCEILVERPQSAVLLPPLQIVPRFQRQFMGRPLNR